jgi:hypothetical protein
MSYDFAWRIWQRRSDLPKCEMQDKQVVHVQMIWTTCEECLDCAVTDRRTTRVQRTRSLILANMSSDANEKASDVLTLLITSVTTTLEVILSIRTIERSKRVRGVQNSLFRPTCFYRLDASIQWRTPMLLVWALCLEWQSLREKIENVAMF